MHKITLFVFALLLGFGFTTQVFAQTPIYSQDFYPQGTPSGWLITHGSQNSPDWTFYYFPSGGFNDDYCMGLPNSLYTADAWAIMQGISLTAGYEYRVEFYQKNLVSSNYHNLKVTVGNAQSIAAQTTELLDLNAVTNNSYINRVSDTFTPVVSGTYYFAIMCYSTPNNNMLLVDLVRVYETIPSVPNPLTFTASVVDNTQIDLSWTKFSSSDNVMVAYTNDGVFGTPADGTAYSVGNTIPGGGEVIYKGSGTAYSHTSLTANTHYYYKAWSVSSSDYYSTGKTADGKTYRTPLDITQLEGFAESFDGTQFPPGDWYTTGIAKENGDWVRYETGINPTCSTHSGAGMAGYKSYTYGSGVKGILVTPPLNLPSEGFQLEFWMYRDNILSNPDRLNVYYNTADDLDGAFRMGQICRYTGSDPEVSTPGWYQYSFNLPTGSAGDFRYIIFEGVSGYGNNIFVDDVTLSYEEPLPVELSAFFVNLSISNLPLLTWITQTETNMAGFRLYRGLSNDLSQAELLSAFIAGSNTTQQQSYVYHDTEPYYNATYYYWLESADLDGSSEFFGPVSIALDFTYVNPPTIPLVTELSSVYPNPFNPETTISYTVAKRSEVQLSIYNVKGQLVRRLVQDFRNPGHYRVNWNGRDEQSRLCSSGSYQIVMRVGTDVFTRKALLLK